MRFRAFLLTAAMIGGLASGAGPAPAAPAVASGSGPAWWHVTKGDSEVWIIGTPDFIPLTLKWDDAALRAHIRGAKSVLIPPTSDQLASRYQASHQDIVWKTLPARLPAPLYRRLSDDISRATTRQNSVGFGAPSLGAVMNALDAVQTYQAGNQLARGTTRPGAIGNTVASRAKGLAAREAIPADMIKAGGALFSRYLAFVDIPEADQVACVEKQVSDFESGAITLANHEAGLAAWARGDVPRALQRYSYANNCAFGATGQHFWDEVTSYSVEALDKALATPGRTVAVLELKPLLMSNGILQKLQQEGARVEGPSLSAAPGMSI